MDELAVDAAVDFPRDTVDEALRRHDLDRHVGEHEFDRLEIADRLPELDALARVPIGGIRGPDRGTKAIGRDLQPRLDEPILGQLEPLADLAEPLALFEFDLLEDEFWMLEDVGVHEFRNALDAHAGKRLVDQEECRLRRITVDMGMDDEIVRVIARRDEPFLAGKIILAATPVGAGLDKARVGAGTRFADRERTASLSLAARHEILLLLLARA